MRWSLNSSYGINIQSEKLSQLKRTKLRVQTNFVVFLKNPE